MTALEQRRVPRVDRPLIARYRAFGSGDAAWFVSPLRNISETGARFLSERTFKPGRLLELHVTVPTSRQPLVLSARVSWTRPAAQELWEVGVHFEVIQPDDRRFLRETVRTVLRRRRDGA